MGDFLGALGNELRFYCKEHQYSLPFISMNTIALALNTAFGTKLFPKIENLLYFCFKEGFLLVIGSC